MAQIQTDNQKQFFKLSFFLVFNRLFNSFIQILKQSFPQIPQYFDDFWCSAGHKEGSKFNIK